MRRYIIPIIIVVWIACSILSYGAMLADIQAIHQDDPVFAAKRCRSNMGAAMLFGMMPISGEVAAIFATGFVEHGFKWSCP